MVIESKAPTRIDLAGGTVDIWPLYLFLDQALTINLGIDLFAEARIEELPGDGSRPGSVHLVSEDLGAELTVRWEDLGSAKAPPALILHHKLLQHFAAARAAAGKLDPASHLSIRTKATSPAGAGLGGSSTLNIALTGALASWAEGARVDVLAQGERLIEISRDIEPTVIQGPAGLQDYYGAMFGGLQSLAWGAGSHARSWLSDELVPELENRLLLFYSGKSRDSGINNWALFKGFIDNQDGVRARFDRIAAATVALRSALARGDWTDAGRAITDEWETRRTLAAGISTPEMDAAWEAARAEGATAFKVCGAGGGGCFFVYVPSGDPRQRERVTARVLQDRPGIRALPFRASRRGLDVRVS